MLKNFLLFGSLLLLTSNAYSKTNFYQVTGSISSVEVLKTYSTQKVPRNEKRCSIQRVPVNQDANKFGADNFIGAFFMFVFSAVRDNWDIIIKINPKTICESVAYFRFW